MSDIVLPDRMPPFSKEAEMGVIGAVLRDNHVLNDVLQTIRADNFYLDAHQKVFQAIADTYSDGKPVDVTIVYEVLKQRKQLEDIGGAPYIAELWDSAPTAANAEYYAKIIREKALVRNLIHAGTEVLRDAYDGVMPADELLGMAERKILEIAEKGTVGETKTLDDSLKEAFTRIDKRAQGLLSSLGVPTGYVDLDNLTAGFHDNELIIIAARPSVGKTAFALNVVRHVIVEERMPVFFVSLEQARIELAERLLACQSRVDSFKIRKGQLSSDDIQKMWDAGSKLKGTPKDPVKLFIDDTPSQNMLRIGANARRLKQKHQIRMVVIDYLQLIEPESRRDPRQEQVAQISRRLKFLARELKIPVVALAQVNRASEDRQDHKPRLSDLRESGCLTGDTLIPLADSGKRVPLHSLIGQSGFRIWAYDESSYRLKPAVVSAAFSTGIKPVFRLTTRLGRTIRATANHPFRRFEGWTRLDTIQTGDRIALPRVLPCSQNSDLGDDEVALLGHLIGDGCTLPRHVIQYTTKEQDLADLVASTATRLFGEKLAPRIQAERSWFQVYLTAAYRLTHGKRNPISTWLDNLGVFGLRSHEKRVPDAMFHQSETTIGRFLRHLWATDGCVKTASGSSRHPAIYYATSSERLARDVQELLLHLGINAVLGLRSQGTKGRDQHPVYVMGKSDILAFADRVGAVGARKQQALHDCRTWIEARVANTNRDIIPSAVWAEIVKPAMTQNRITMRALQSRMNMSFCGTTLYRQNVSRERMARVAKAVGDHPQLHALATSDIYWDEVVNIQPDGVEEVFDLTVPDLHNFVANGIVVHNSIEQDADTVMILHRPGKFDGASEDNTLEVIVAKQRNGPTGEVMLAYLKQFMRYENYAADAGYGGSI